MSRVLSPPVNCRTTDHSDEIRRLRDIADQMSVVVPAPGTNARALMDWELRLAAVKCAASLLECHDDTGISLDDWSPGPKDLVNVVLEQYEMGELLENHV